MSNCLLETSPLVGCAEDRPRPGFFVWLMDPWCRTPWYTAELGRGLEDAGHTVRLVSPSYQLERDYFAGLGLRPDPGPLNLTSRLPIGQRAISQGFRLLEYAANVTALRSELRKHPPQVIHHQQCVLLERGWQAEIDFLRTAKRRGVPVVHTVHNLLPHRQRPFHREAFAALYRLCDALICHDKSTADRVCAQFGNGADRVFVIPHGPLFARVPPETPGACRQILGIPEDRQVFLALGVLAPYKGLDVLISAFQRFLLSATGANRPLLVIAGSGPRSQIADLLSQARGLISSGCARTDLHYIPSRRIPLYLQAADVLLYPYRDISTSGALLTGLNYCKPIVASDLAPFRPYLRAEHNAKLAHPGDVEGLAQALLDVSNPETFERLCRGSRDNSATQVQWSEIVARTTALYRSLIR